jgi:hypothetical protein
VPDPAFWIQLAGAIGSHNTRRLDYVGLDPFPDVFRPISHQNLTGAVTSLVQRFRTVTAEAAPKPARLRRHPAAHRPPDDPDLSQRVQVPPRRPGSARAALAA